MTRENKLALVIGFGLLMLAGILVSDHLSAGKRSGEEPLLASGEQVIPPSTLLQSRTQDATSTPLRTENRANQNVDRSVAPVRQRPTEPAPLRQITIGGGFSSPTPPAAGSGNAPTSTHTVHYVKKNETLSAISKKYYGSPDHAAAIARSNNIPNPQRIRVGTRLVIADQPGGSIGTRTTARASGSNAAPRSGPRVIKVREGETLSGIAKRELGSERKWHELWEMNKKVVPDPNRLSPGITLTLPAT